MGDYQIVCSEKHGFGYSGEYVELRSMGIHSSFGFAGIFHN
jgi:hypothetical protein